MDALDQKGSSVIVYLLTAIVVFLAALAYLRWPHAHKHPPAIWACATFAAGFAVLWPVLAAWGVFYGGSWTIYRMFNRRDPNAWRKPSPCDSPLMRELKNPTPGVTYQFMTYDDKGNAVDG